MVEELFQIKANLGLVPVIAHIDRYIRYQPRDVMSAVLSGEILIQMNADALARRSLRSACMKMLRAGEVDFLGSDCHNLTDRSPDMSVALGAIEGKLGGEMLDELAKFGSYALKDADFVI